MSGMAGPLLSVCIPTYNRIAHLVACLDSVRIALGRCACPIEVVVSDNASTDGTSAYLAGLMLGALEVRVVTQPKNIGGERNFRAVAKAARGRFVWIFGDDDLLEPDAVAAVVASLDTGVSAVVCNYSIWNLDLSRKVALHGLPGPSVAVCADKNLVMRRFGLNLGYISSVIIRRDLFLAVSDEQYEEFVSFGFPFLYATFVGLSRECRVAFLAEPVLRNRTGNSGNYDWYRYFVEGSCLIFARLVHRHGYGAWSIAAAKNRSIAQYVVRQLFATRRSGGDTTGLVALLFRHYKFLPMFWLGIVPVAFVPRRMLEAVIDVAKALRSRLRGADRAAP